MGKKAVLCEVYARVVGYYRPTLNYNIGKKQEWSERKLICPSKSIGEGK